MTMEKKHKIIGRIDRKCDLCGLRRECHVIETRTGPAIVCPACKKKKYKGVK